jgi:hypothetical protein
MFNNTSRYFDLKDKTYTGPDGREIVYKKRRFLPPGDSMQVLTDVVVSHEDRLDLIAARTLGAPDQFWMICDANNSMNPFDDTAEQGRMLRVPVPFR